jgi:hypothetical protein
LSVSLGETCKIGTLVLELLPVHFALVIFGDEGVSHELFAQAGLLILLFSASKKVGL